MSLRLATWLLMIALVASPLNAGLSAAPGDDMAAIVARNVAGVSENVGGVAVAVRAEGHSRFFNFGMADPTRLIGSDLVFNLGSLGKVFDAVLLAHSAARGELSLDDPVAKHVVELRAGGDVRAITLRQLATHTSGFVLPQDHPPWPKEAFTLPQFIAALNAWTADQDHRPGAQMIYSHAGFVLLHLALERRFGLPYGELMRQRVLDPLGLAATSLPVATADAERNPRGELPRALVRRAVQGYLYDGTPFGAPGDVQGYYHWLGTGQMYASPRDMAMFAAANLGELPPKGGLQAAMRRAQRSEFPLGEGAEQALAWLVQRGANPGDDTIVEKYGGLDNATAYIGLMPERRLAVVLLGNRGNLALSAAGHAVLRELARR
jgi:beta-lactamase class C